MNEALALSDEILLSVTKPERYIGNEVNAVYKDRSLVDVRFAFVFPDVYDIGMANLALQILYGMMNEWDDVWCERVFSPWTDLDAIMREKGIPLFALESQDPLKEFDFLGFTLQYELCYTNVLQVLELAGIELYAADRGKDDPIVMGGGPCTYNPEPVADFFDLFYIGEGETRFREMLDVYKECRKEGMAREDILRRLSRIPGIYVPSMYDVAYNDDGTIKAVSPRFDDVPPTIEKELVTDLNECYYPLKPVVPFSKVTQDRVVLEILRGCIRGCRFCQAGQLYRPFRERDVKKLMEWGVTMLENTGYDEVSLSSLSSSDHSSLKELVEFLIEYCTPRHINISLPSLRIDAFSLDVMQRVQDVKKSSLTFAPEAGTQRLRNVINKGLTEEDILNGSHDAFEGGWNKVKLYFMLGIPTESDDDIAGIADIANRICGEYYDTVPKDKRNGRAADVTVSTSFFIPKPFTPFQWAPMNTRDEFVSKAGKTKAAIRSVLNQKHIHYNWHEADASMIEGVFARGDRKLSRAIERAYRSGCLYDAWSETFRYDLWLCAFEETGIDPDFYTIRTRERDEVFPWDHLSCGVSKAFLYREWERALDAKVSVNCRDGCMGCGASSYKTGCCPGKREAS